MAARKSTAKKPKPTVGDKPQNGQADKRGRGQPTAYRGEFAEQARKLCELGATDIELADFFKVSDRTIYRWAAKHDDFCQALKAGKDAADERVVRSLYHKAVGYTFDSEKVFQHQGQIVRAQTREHVPPDTTAGIFWLKNRRKDEFRDRIDHEHSGGVSVEHSGLSPADRLAKLADMAKANPALMDALLKAKG